MKKGSCKKCMLIIFSIIIWGCILANVPIFKVSNPNQKDYIRKLIAAMAVDKTIIISTHLLEEAETICSRIILLDKGKIKADGKLEDILKKAQADTLADAFRNLTAH